MPWAGVAAASKSITCGELTGPMLAVIMMIVELLGLLQAFTYLH
jgi:hypothetical protein